MGKRSSDSKQWKNPHVNSSFTRRSFRSLKNSQRSCLYVSEIPRNRDQGKTRPQPHSVWMSPADRANCEYYQGLQDAETSNTDKTELVDDISKSIRSGALVTGATEMNDGGIQSEVAEMNGWYDRREGDG